MVRPLRSKLAPPKKLVPKKDRSVTPLIYYGGKSRDAAWIVNHFPPHNTFVDLFGGGGAITLYKIPSVTDIYNDIGNVCNFFRVLRNWPDDLYSALYYTPWSRQEFYDCRLRWKEMSDELLAVMMTSEAKYRDIYDIPHDPAVEWARCWYATIIQGHTHEELESSWKVAKSVDVAFAWRNHVEDLPRHSERLRGLILENLDFAKVINLYDSPDTLFYCDPPYTPGSRASQDNYIHEMPLDRHVQLLTMLNEIKGQAVVSMYSDPMYERALSGWKRDTISHLSAIQNSAQMRDGRDTRTEVLWIREHQYGLWSTLPPPALPGVQEE